MKEVVNAISFLPFPTNMSVNEMKVGDKVKIINEQSKFYGVTGTIAAIEDTEWVNVILDQEEEELAFNKKELEVLKL